MAKFSTSHRTIRSRRTYPSGYPARRILLLLGRFKSLFALLPAILFISGLLVLATSPAFAASSTLTVTPITWNVIGLDSNSPASGPYRFPVGARVCSSASTTNVVVDWVWDSSNTYINLRPGSLSQITIASIAAGGCSDAYFEVEVTQVSPAYDTTRRYHITATDTSGTASTPTPRELYVEHLISQNRNGITDVKLNGTSIPAGGTMNLMVGNTYTITLDGFTATQGYNQLESFINFPNTIFQVRAVTTTYTADSNTTHVPNPSNKLYADTCLWDSDPGSPNYRSCIGGDDKAGGTIVVIYTVKILSGAGTTQPLNTLLYDFSGSSYHYNADYATGARVASIISSSSVTIQKTFTPRAITPGGTSVMTFKLTNPTTEIFTGVNFTDTLLSGLVVSSTVGVSYSGCGAGAFSPALTGGESSFSFANGTLSANSVCTINVNVTAPAGTYPNTTGHLFINTSTDTGNTGSDTLTASSATACIPNQTLATWTMPTSGQGSGGPPPPYTIKASNVVTATASAGAGISTAIETSIGNPVNSWSGTNFSIAATLTQSNNDYFEFAVDTSKYSGIGLKFDGRLDANLHGPNDLALYYSTDGTNFTSKSIITATGTFTTTTTDFTGQASTTGTTYFRIYGYNAGNNGADAILYLDNVIFTGCSIPAPAPTIAKSFSPNPISKGLTSTLTITLTNTASGNQALTGVAITDTLPLGLSVADSTSSTCGGTNNLTTTASARKISLTGGTLSAGGSCTFTVTVTGTTEGQYNNVTDYISSTESGTSTNYATASLDVIAPPVLAKSFSPGSIFTGVTSTLSFLINNPNLSDSLTGIGFTDTLPVSLTVASSGPTATCNGSLSTTALHTISFSGGSLAANSNCTFTVTVTGALAGTANNTTTAVTSTEGGNGNTATASLVVRDPMTLISVNKQISTDNTNWVKYVGLIPTQNVYYKFTVSNDGEATLNNVSVTDPNFNMASCAPALPTSLAIGDSASCVIGPVSISSVPAPNPFVNTATITTTTYTPTTPITSTAKYGTESLALSKSVTETSFTAAGNFLNYSYAVTNTGGYPLLGPVVITDTKTTVACPTLDTVGNLSNYLDPSETITCTATYTVTAGDITAHLVTNSAYATVDGVQSNTDSKTVNQVSADLAITKSVNPDPVYAGSTVTYTLAITNNGTATASNVAVTDTLVGGTVFITATGTSWSCNASGVCTTSSLTAGASSIITVTATAPSAGGTITNTATITSITYDPIPNNNTSQITSTVLDKADLAITKSVNPNPVNAGSTLTYTLTITNSGPSTASNVVVTDTLLGSTSFITATGTNWSCNASGVCTTSSLTAGASSIITVTATAPSAGGTITNTATITSTTYDPIPNNNTHQISSTVTSIADLGILKTHAPSTVIPGQTITYTLVVTNAGPSAVTGATITDTFPISLTGATWTCSASTGSNCTSGSGNINTTANILANGAVTYTITATVSSSAAGTLVNTGYVAPPNGTIDPNPSNNSSQDTATVQLTADLGILKTHAPSTVIPGQTITYTLVVTNVGPSAVTGVTITDTFSGALTSPTWTCTASVGSSCTSGSGNINTTANVLANGIITYTITATVSSSATGTLVNTGYVAPPAGITDPNPSNNSSQDTATVQLTADLGILKTHAPASAIPGQTITYTLVVTNAGPSAVTGATITDTFPVALTSPAWTCSASTGSNCTSGSGNINTTANILANGSVTYTITATVSSSATGTLVNTGYVAPPNGTIDPNPGNNSSQDTATLSAVADLAIAKTHSGNFIVGQTGTYTITVTNNGPSTAVPTITVTDTLPTGLSFISGTGAGWSCAAAICTNASPLAAGAVTTITLNVGVSSSAIPGITNTVAVSSPTSDPTPGNNTATNPTTVTTSADLVLAKTHGGNFSVGVNGTYTLTVTNNGPSTAVGPVVVTDTLPAGLTYFSGGGGAWSCSNTGQNVTCTRSTDLTFGSTSSFTMTVLVSSGAIPSVINNAGVSSTTSDPNPSNNLASDLTLVGANADLALTKTHAGSFTVGSNGTYTLTVTNNGTGTALGAIVVTDTLPSGLSFVSGSGTGWSPCSAVGQNVTCNHTNDMSSGESATVTLTVGVAIAASPSVTNTATAASSTSDPSPSNNTATDPTMVLVPVDLQISKTDGQSSLTLGLPVTYTIVVTNTGPYPVIGAIVNDNFPAALTGATWNCAAAGSGTCGALSGVGNISTTVDLPLNATATFIVTATVASSATGTLTNTATITVPVGMVDPVPGNNSATDVDTLIGAPDVGITKSDGGISATANSLITYTLQYSNTGNASASNVLISEAVPANTTFAGPAGLPATWTCNVGNGAGTPCLRNIGVLGIGASGSVSFVVRVNASLPITTTAITNTVTISDDGTNGVDPNPGNNTAQDATPITGLAAALALSKTANISTVNPGSIITYTLRYTNTGNTDANNVVITETVPISTTFFGPPATWSCGSGSPAGTTCTLAIGTLVGAVGSGTAQFVVIAANPLPSGATQINNTVVIGDDSSHTAVATLGLLTTPTSTASKLYLPLIVRGLAVPTPTPTNTPTPSITPTPTATPVLADPKGFVSDPNRDHLYLVSNGDGTVDVFQESTFTGGTLPLRKISVGRGPFGIGMVNDKVYVANFSSASVSVISAATMNKIKDISVSSCGTEATHLAVNPNTGLVYVALHGNAKVAVINSSTDLLSACISVGQGGGTFGGTFGIAVHPASNTIFVGNRDTKDLWRINGATGFASSVTNATGGGAPYYVGTNPISNTLFMMVGANPDIPNDLYVYDISLSGNLQNKRVVRVGNTDDGGFVIQSQCSGLIYIAETRDDKLRILNSDLSLYGTLAPASGLIDPGPYGLLENAALKRVYVSNKPSNTIKVLNECPGPLAPAQLPATPTRTQTPGIVATSTYTPTVAITATTSPTLIGSPTLTRTVTATATATSTPLPSSTRTPTATLNPTSRPTLIGSPTLTRTATSTATATFTSLPSSTRTPTATATSTPTR